MLNRLFTASELEKEYGITELPSSWRQSEEFRNELAAKEQIESMLSDPAQRRRLIESVQWHKVDVHKRQNNKRRLTLSLTKPQFMTQCAESTLDNAPQAEVELVPILMFNSETEAKWLEHVWVVSLEQGVSVGIALRSEANGVRVTGLHLDGAYLRQQHELALPAHGDCRCLDHFESKISDLRIGNPDDLQNKINYYQQVIKVLSQYKEGVKALMRVDPHHLAHFQAVQRQAIQQHGHHQQHVQPAPPSPQPHPQRFQRHLSPKRLPVPVASPQPQQLQLHQQQQQQTVRNGYRSGHSVQRMAMVANG